MRSTAATACRPEPVVVGSFDTPMAAQLAVLRLQQDGIDARLFDDQLLTADPLIHFAVGGVKVAVAPADAEAARAILAQHCRQLLVARCPECGAADLERRQAGRRAAWLSAVLLGFPIGRARARCRCRSCGHCWRG